MGFIPNVILRLAEVSLMINYLMRFFTTFRMTVVGVHNPHPYPSPFIMGEGKIGQRKAKLRF